MMFNLQTSPADLRGALNAIATTTVEEHKASQSKINKPPPAKRRKITASINARVSQQKATASETQEEVYHFIGYVPAHGKVWELDGLKSGPLEVGELPEDSTAESWMDVVRPALRMKMEKYGGDAGGEANIRFNLLALVDDRYQVASDEYGLLSRKNYRLEKRLDEQFSTSWREEVCSFARPRGFSNLIFNFAVWGGFGRYGRGAWSYVFAGLRVAKS